MGICCFKTDKLNDSDDLAVSLLKSSGHRRSTLNTYQNDMEYFLNTDDWFRAEDGIDVDKFIEDYQNYRIDQKYVEKYYSYTSGICKRESNVHSDLIFPFLKKELRR